MQNLEDMIIEAEKCLSCKNPMCTKGCPIGTNIPQFINQLKNNNMLEAYKILQENNIMSDICSNVCPYEEYCTGNCVKGIKGEPVKVYKLEKFVNIWARDNNVSYKHKCKKCNNINIAIIGSGPAGIACSVELAKEGFCVTIFEKKERVGGLLTYGIPGFRLPRNITDKLRNKLDELEINVKTNIEFGKDITIESLKKDGFKYIFVAIGCDIPSTYKLTDVECNNIYKSNYILREYNNKNKIENLGDVVIIGGGNVSTDSARAVLRMGAKSATILYRGNPEKMPARKVELDAALKEGTKIIYNTKVIGAETKNNKINKLKCVNTIMENNILVNIENSDHYINTDTVIFAIGFKTDEKLLTRENINLIDNNKIQINDAHMTNIDGVFAGGDSCKGRATVCDAILDGKIVAKEIIKLN